ncbi:MAG: hypothetical protein EB830_02005 [Nitrosopumilus sp. H13]|nr:MAG: hypothetical protein EB830_02005 [Nitrosopumilus sp. H13]
MVKPVIRFLDVPRDPMEQTTMSRIVDWEEEGDHLLQILRKYEDGYREKICSRCNMEQQVKRKCIKMHINGKILTYCDHMRKAKSSKFKKEIHHHMFSHPVFFTHNMLRKT